MSKRLSLNRLYHRGGRESPDTNSLSPTSLITTETRKLRAPEGLIEHNQTYGLQIVIIEAVFIFEEVFESAASLRFIKRLFSQEWRNSSLSTSFLAKG